MIADQENSASETRFAAADQMLAELGYAVIEDVLPAEQVQQLRAEVIELARAEAEAGDAWVSNGNQRVFALLNKGDMFIDLVQHPLALVLAEDMLTENVLLSSVTAHCVQAGNVAQGVHADQDYIWGQWGAPYVLNAVWALDDFRSENGGTVVYPGTHLVGHSPDDTTSTRPSISVECPAGSLILLDGRLWHGSGRHGGTDGQRVAILAYYCAPFLRQQENVFRSLRPEVRNGLSDRMRTLLGYDVWSGLGVTGGLPRTWMDRPGPRSGPTNADHIFPE